MEDISEEVLLNKPFLSNVPRMEDVQASQSWHRSIECPPHAANSWKIGSGSWFKPNFGVVWSYVNVATDSWCEVRVFRIKPACLGWYGSLGKAGIRGKILSHSAFIWKEKKSCDSTYRAIVTTEWALDNRKNGTVWTQAHGCLQFLVKHFRSELLISHSL